MIKRFKDKRAKAIFEGRHPGKGFPADLIRPARRKLIMLAEAKALKDLRSPPSNHLEALKKGSRRSALDQDQRSVAGLLRLDRK